ncbi:MAG: LptF/LptG family permease, partial [Bacteroidota bacterium]
MKILDLYILRRFLVTYIFTVLVLIAVLIVIDLAEKVQDFNHPDLTTWRIIKEYYINFVPYYANMLSPLIIFIAAVFVTAKMATHTEIIAIVSGGINLARIIQPFLMGSVLIAVLVFYLINYVVPPANRIRNNFENNFVRSKFYFNEKNVHIKVAPQTYVYLESYDNISHTGYRFTMETIKGTELQEKLDAPRINWNQEL